LPSNAARIYPLVFERSGPSPAGPELNVSTRRSKLPSRAKKAWTSGSALPSSCSDWLTRSLTAASRSGSRPVVAPTRRLVVGGLYRYLRNPMYVAVVSVLLGQVLILLSPVLLGYAAIAAAAMVGFVLGCEQPALASG
jgi:protein-S-isoprenylcysteine O-methyltransferase Ste14